MPGINITLDVVLSRHRQLLREAEAARIIGSASHGRSRRRIQHGVGRALLSLGLRLQSEGQAVEVVAIRRADGEKPGNEGRCCSWSRRTAPRCRSTIVSSSCAPSTRRHDRERGVRTTRPAAGEYEGGGDMASADLIKGEISRHYAQALESPSCRGGGDCCDEPGEAAIYPLEIMGGGYPRARSHSGVAILSPWRASGPARRCWTWAAAPGWTAS
jgi:hypothetical protein